MLGGNHKVRELPLGSGLRFPLNLLRKRENLEISFSLPVQSYLVLIPQILLTSSEMPSHIGKHCTWATDKKAAGTQRRKSQLPGEGIGGWVRRTQEGSTQEKREGRDPSDMCKRDNGKTIQPEQRCSSGKEENEVRCVEQRRVVVPKVGKRRFDSMP